jgi:4-amino-4-deoxy-L-arabinose transferase-like glycosyltransferase
LTHVIRQAHRQPIPHALRVALLMAAAAAWLGWQVAHTEILFADGLRYIEQGRQLERGNWTQGVRKAIDHPLYPLAIATTHRLLGGDDGPDSWQLSAQFASAISGVLLVVPLYLTAWLLFGGSTAWLGCAWVFLTPVPSHVFADALSESTFLLFWTWGLWFGLRFLREGHIAWLSAAMLAGGLAYLTRPEGLLLPLALAGSVALCPLFSATRLPLWASYRALGLLGVSGLCLIAPYMIAKGGIGTKPAVARLLGLAPPSEPDAVERERPLDPKVNPGQVLGEAAFSTFSAIRGVTTLPLLALAMIGFCLTIRRARGAGLRSWLLLGLIVAASLLALTRLHETGGYCAPRHALLIGLPTIAASAAGFRSLFAVLIRSGGARFLRLRRTSARTAPVVFSLLLAGLNGPALLAPVNEGAGGYVDAGRWLARNVPASDQVVDVTGWALFYSQKTGYVFANLIEAGSDPQTRWVVAREAHLSGPWAYCSRLRTLIVGASLVARFPEERRSGQARVLIYRRSPQSIPASLLR